MKETVINNITYHIGRNAKDNTEMIKGSDGEWYWFHLAGVPSCHVIVTETDFDKPVIVQAAALVYQYSKPIYKNFPVTFCKVNQLTHGSKDGMVKINGLHGLYSPSLKKQCSEN